NICTAQVLLAVMASMYAVYHGPDGLAAIAERVHRLARILQAGLAEAGVDVAAGAIFDTVLARVPGRAETIVAAAVGRGINLRHVDTDTVGISCDEVTARAHIVAVWAAFGIDLDQADVERIDASVAADDPAAGVRRATPFLTHPVFSAHRS